jgi:GAF domain-containing protein
MPPASLSAAVERLSHASTTEDIIGIVRGCARGLIGSDGIALVMRDGDHCHYVEEDAIGPLWRGRRFPMASCISGWSMLHRQTVAISDIFLDQRIPHDLYRATFVRSLVMAPIRRADPVGALGAYWKQAYEPNLAEVETVEALAEAAAAALKKLPDVPRK